MAHPVEFEPSFNMKSFINAFLVLAITLFPQLLPPSNAAVVLIEPQTLQQIEEDIFEASSNDDMERDEAAELKYNSVNVGEDAEEANAFVDQEEVVLVPAGWRRFRRRIGSAFRRLGNVFRRIPAPVYTLALSKH